MSDWKALNSMPKRSTRRKKKIFLLVRKTPGNYKSLFVIFLVRTMTVWGDVPCPTEVVIYRVNMRSFIDPLTSPV